MEAIASTVYDLTIGVDLMEDGTVRISWATGQPGHVSADYDEGDDEDLDGLHTWVSSHTLGELARLADAPEVKAPAPITLRDGDVIKVLGKGAFNRQRLGTVSGYARQYRENETAAIDKAQERGHKLVWLNAECVVIAANPASVDRSFVAEVEPGQAIYLDSPHAEERGLYRVELPRPRHLDGDNCRLVRIED